MSGNTPSPTGVTTTPNADPPAPEPTSIIPQLTISLCIALIYAGVHAAAWLLKMDGVFNELIATDNALIMIVVGYWLGGSLGSDKKTTAMLGAVNRQVPPPVPPTPPPTP